MCSLSFAECNWQILVTDSYFGRLSWLREKVGRGGAGQVG